MSRIKIKRNAIKCNFCGDIIESEYTHDFKGCSCGRCYVDGGKSYLRRLADDPSYYTELSDYTEEGDNSK